MNEKLKQCPFCGGTKICTEKSINLNYCDNCSAESNVEHWNNRPIEDALTARIAELSQAVGLITTLKPTMVMDADHPLEMAKEVAEYVTARIAELEAEVTELKPYRDGYDAYEDFPEEGENVIANLGSWLFLAQRRGDKWYDSLGQQAEIRGGVERWWKLPEVTE